MSAPMTAHLRAGQPRADDTTPVHLHRTGHAPRLLGDTESPELVVLEAARAGFALLPGTAPPQYPGQRADLQALPASTWACPPWCTSCRTRLVLGVVTNGNVPHLSHTAPLGDTRAVHGRARGWALTLTRQVRLSVPPWHGRAGIALAPVGPPGPAVTLTTAEAEHLAALLTAGTALAATTDTTPEGPR